MLKGLQPLGQAFAVVEPVDADDEIAAHQAVAQALCLRPLAGAARQGCEPRGIDADGKCGNPARLSQGFDHAMAAAADL